MANGAGSAGDSLRGPDRSIQRAGPSSVLIRPMPNIVFLWPAALAGFISALIMVMKPESDAAGHAASTVFFLPLAFNFIVISFDFSRGKVIMLGLAFLSLFIAVMYLNLTNPTIVSGVRDVIGNINMIANAQFYFAFSILLSVVYCLVYVATRFNYWEITNNELIHHHGMLGDVDRFPAPSLRLSKEIDDVFQWMLAGSGRLIFYPADQKHAIVLDNVLRINHVENKIKELLSTLSVTVHSKPE